MVLSINERLFLNVHIWSKKNYFLKIVKESLEYLKMDQTSILIYKHEKIKIFLILNIQYILIHFRKNCNFQTVPTFDALKQICTKMVLKFNSQA